MKLNIRSLAIGPLAKVMAIATAIVSVPFALLMALFAVVMGGSEGGPVAAAAYLLLPLFYLIFAYLTTALFVWIFNKVAEQTGGIPMEVDELAADRDASGWAGPPAPPPLPAAPERDEPDAPPPPNIVT